jgi:hypothetical protein
LPGSSSKIALRKWSKMLGISMLEHFQEMLCKNGHFQKCFSENGQNALK